MFRAGEGARARDLRHDALGARPPKETKTDYEQTVPDRLLSKADARLGAILVVLFGAAYVVVSRFAFHGFAYSGDEYSALLQAEIFARGSLATHAPAHSSLFWVDHVIIDDWVRSKYPPGSSALLALGVLVHAPWVVTPLEGAATLFFLRHAARVTFGERAAVVTVLVGGASPLFIFHAASFYSHTTVTMWIAAAVAAIAEHGRDPRKRWLLWAGVAVGCAFLTRPLDAVLFGAALLALRDVRALAWIALAAIPVAALTFAYQKAQFGAPFIDGYRVYVPTFRALYGDEGAQQNISLAHALDGELQWHHLALVRELFVAWTVPGSIALAIVGVRASPPEASRFRDVLLALAAVTTASLIPLHTAPDDGALPRYITSLVIPLALFAGPGWIAIEEALHSRVSRAWSNGAGLTLVALGALSFAAFLDLRLPAVWMREGLAREVEARGLTNAVVVVHAQFPSRYTRNGPTFDGPVLYVRAGVASDAEIAAWFPGRTIYEATEGRPWSIHPVVPPS